MHTLTGVAVANFPFIESGTRQSTLRQGPSAPCSGFVLFSGRSKTGSSDPDTRSSCSEGEGMMRRRHPWWALLTATALMMASLLAPMEGAAKEFLHPVEPVDRGDPDNPGSGKAGQVSRAEPRTEIAFVLALPLVPGGVLVVRVPLPMVMNHHAKRSG